MNTEKRFAILIDGDNISSEYIKTILDEIYNKGVATYKRIYGDWTKPNLSKWKDILLEYSITPMQQYSYTIGKNA
ncbi:MAG: NYN domain-containing protein, partial [Oscillospiraceae bacterium]